MVNTRSQTKMAVNADLFALLAEMMKSMEKGQEEMKQGQEVMKKGQEEMKKVQEEMKKELEMGQQEMKNLIRAEKEEMRAHIENQVEEMKEHVNRSISRRGCPSSTNEWTSPVKASQLVASLRGSAAEVLQGIPSDKLTDLTTIENALEARFGDSHLTQFYRTELKTRRQKPEESLQVLAAGVERLMSLAYVEFPQDVRDSLAAQYFVDGIRDENTQHATRLMDAKDLKTALAYSMEV
ncbi:hypothetical protein AVEN_43781-1 [Araneus ventricosus]|uniref:Uncharacterized protein n=1 Tax=Araneus ventricosus TaxID=182803 RepID=A0A4Y2JPX3_ARAVE|nr:hypothetical protein AVEN_103087-1 [Araneus ventricosus]GBM92451.1 hypothetical protein AVEN_256387-1 [Araneus ventricosus]GBM92464.1 hypothetical protein AVEN_40699-1 [Araneus ventricosus]GBM92468.1 hypothetical protein AVEN_43781-1 [Araneus ventricosus]